MQQCACESVHRQYNSAVNRACQPPPLPDLTQGPPQSQSLLTRPERLYAGYIFDLDGTLIDTMPLHYRAWDAVMRSAGLQGTLDEDLFYSLGGVPTVRVAELIGQHYGIAVDTERVFHEKEALFHELQADAILIKPVAEFARRAAATHPLAIASGGTRDIVQRSASADGAIEHDLLTSHVRSLMPGHLTDVASNDQHNVKPWFNGRLDYSPPVHDLSDAGFPLVGGRVDYVGNRAVAVLVYQRRQHLISVYVWPSPADIDGGAERTPMQTRQGYHMLSWTSGGMTRWAISDLNEAELAELARLEQRASPPAASP